MINTFLVYKLHFWFRALKGIASFRHSMQSKWSNWICLSLTSCGLRFESEAYIYALSINSLFYNICQEKDENKQKVSEARFCEYKLQSNVYYDDIIIINIIQVLSLNFLPNKWTFWHNVIVHLNKCWAVVVAHLVERLIPAPEVRGSNPVIGKLL